MPVASTVRMAPRPDNIDFTLSSSLPPMVEGPLAGEIELLVPYLYPKPGALCSMRYLRDGQREPLFVVRLQWWGDGGPGTVLKPALLSFPDVRGERARRARMSKVTCALFPVRCGAEGLAAYLEDMGTITLDVLVHEGEPRGARLVGRCVIPVGGWGKQKTEREGLQRSDLVAKGYFPVLSLNDNKHGGDLGVRLRACVGQGSKLRGVLEAAKVSSQEKPMGRETREIVEILEGCGIALLKEADGIVARGNGRLQELMPTPNERQVATEGTCEDGLAPQTSFDSGDLTATDASSEASLIVDANEHFHRQSAQVLAFQLNEALAAFDASDTLPVWPTPKSVLYRAPETLGEATPMPRDGITLRGKVAPGANVGGRRKTPMLSKKSAGLGSNNPPVCVGDTQRQPESRGELMASVSPERQAPKPNLDPTATTFSFQVGEDQAHAQASPPRAEISTPKRLHATDAATASTDNRLSELLNRGKELRDKMIMVAEKPPPPRVANMPARLSSEASPSANGAETFGDICIRAQPGLLSGAPLGSSLRDDIEGIFDTLSDGDSGIERVDVLVRDTQTRGHEERVVDLLLEAAGPPPSSLAYPALAAVEHRRADALARARFLRIRLSRLVMFGAMTSSTEGHGWQLRFRLPALAAPPGRGSFMGRTAAAWGNQRHYDGWNARVVSLPVPPRVPSASRVRNKVTRRSKSAPGTVGIVSSSMLRVRRGFGASDLVVGETPLLEEVVCAVAVDDGCVRQWMDATLEFLLVDGKSDGASRPRARPRTSQTPVQKDQQQHVQSSTVGSGDRVAAVASLPLRDLLLSADLGIAATLDLIEVSDFWAVEEARVTAAGVRGRWGRPLRNPYRDPRMTGARPLILGDRAVGALAVSLELVPGNVDVSPEDSRPEVERGFNRKRGKITQETEGGGVDLQSERSLRSDGGNNSQPGTTTSSARPAATTIPAEEKSSVRGVLEHLPVSQMGADDGARSVTPRVLTTAANRAQTLPSASETHNPPEAKCDVLLRLLGLTLAPAAGSGIESVRVAYSFTQVDQDNPSVTHRSVRGLREPKLKGDGGAGRIIPTFKFDHQEVFPAPKDRKRWHSSASATRVFEVWSMSVGTSDRVEGPGGEALLGLAKISLEPFSVFDYDVGTTRAGLGAEANAVSLAIAADGPVVVTDPFSGRVVGELCVLLALGPSRDITELRSSGADSCEGNQGATPVDEGREEHKSVREKGDEDNARSQVGEVRGAQEESGELDESGPLQEASALDDSVAELSMLLNQARSEGFWGGVEKARSSGGGFTGLVRHVMELSVVGEVPLAIDAGTLGEDVIDEPLGCTIEYILPNGCEASLDTDVDRMGVSKFVGAEQTHELWWDADSGILNSRARHTIKVSSGGGEPAAMGEDPAPDRSLDHLLDCMLGPGDVILSLSWSLGEAPRVRAGGSVMGGADEGASKRERREMGKAVFRREDLLPLVKKTSASAVLRLPVEPSRRGGEGGMAPPAPEMLPLSVSYRREPSAVARRKSRGWSGRVSGSEVGDGLALSRQETKRQRGVSASSPNSDGACGNRADERVADWHCRRVESSGEVEGDGDGIPCPEVKDNNESHQGVSLSPSSCFSARRAGTPRRSEDDSAESFGIGSPSEPGDARDNSAHVRRFSSAESLRPDRAMVSVTVETVNLVNAAADSEDGLVWASFEFPDSDCSGLKCERRRGDVFVWRPEGEDPGGSLVHWSPPVESVRRDEGVDRASLAWRVECPVRMDAAFVEYVHTQSLELHVWKGRRGLWPKGGAACGVAKVALRQLLVKLGGIGGDVTLYRLDGLGGRTGSVTILLSFSHRSLSFENGPPADQAADKVAVDRGMRKEGNDGEKREMGEAREGPGTLLARVSSGREAARATLAAPELETEHSWSEISLPRWRGGPRDPPLESSLRGKLVVHVEQAMRLRSTALRETAQDVPAVEGASPSPSTYVSFRWEEAGKPPLRPVLTLEAARPDGTGQDKHHDWQSALIGDEEATTPVVENASNPVFKYAAELHPVGADAWGRLCGPSAAIVFRVWRRAYRCRWDTSRTGRAIDDGDSGSVYDRGVRQEEGVKMNTEATPATPQLGDKLIGSAVVRLEVLRGAVGTHEGVGLGLPEIDGWYHVLDDLQRPQGQIKVRVIPQLPEDTRDPQPGRLEHPPTVTTPRDTGDTGIARLLLPATHGPSLPSDEAAGTEQSWVRSKTLPPLHDTQTHLRAVHALLESLPAEVRSDRPRQPQSQSSPLSSETRVPVDDDTVGFPVRSGKEAAMRAPSLAGAVISYEGETSQASASCDGQAEKERYDESPNLPELRQMLRSLDKVDRRLSELGTSGGDCESDRGGRCGVNDPTLDLPTGTGVVRGTIVAGVEANGLSHAAASRLQRAWRAWCRSKQKAKKEALAKAEREAYLRRQWRREEAAATMQSMYRRAQARYRARTATEERRRWRSRQQRRAAACATLERAWSAFRVRRKAARELVERRARAAAVVQAERRAEVAARAASTIQATWRGTRSRAAVYRLRMARIRTTCVRSGSTSGCGVATVADGIEAPLAGDTLQPAPPAGVNVPLAEPALSSGRSLPLMLPLTFYNQLSQDPRRSIRLPDAHVAATTSVAVPIAGLPVVHAPPESDLAVAEGRVGETREKLGPSVYLGPRSNARLAGAIRPTRFADLETARIARIMKSNLQHRAGLHSGVGGSSSSEDFGS